MLQQLVFTTKKKDSYFTVHYIEWNQGENAVQ